MSQNEFLTTPDRLYALLSDNSKEVHDAFGVSIIILVCLKN